MILKIFAIGYEKFGIQPSRVYYSVMNISVIKQDITHEKNAVNSTTCVCKERRQERRSTIVKPEVIRNPGRRKQ